MFKIGLVGYDLSYTLSPAIHEFNMNSTGDFFKYELYEITDKKKFREEIMKLKKDKDLIGFNITIPYKEMIIPYIDHLDSLSKIIGAVNTVKVVNGEFYGFNTDGIGLIKSLKSEKVELYKGRVLVIGTGGAAKSIVVALGSEDVLSIEITGRNEAAGRDILAKISHVKNDFKILNEKLNLNSYDIIIQTTPVGMTNHEGLLNLNYNTLKEDCVLCDIIYEPRETKFLKEGRIRNLKTINGYGMLFFQGVAAFEKWTGKKANKKELDSFLENFKSRV